MKTRPKSQFFSPKFVKIAIYLAMVIFTIGITLAITIAYILGGDRDGPGHFSIMNNYISDLGSHHYTVAPFIFDVTMMITAVFLVPIMLTMHEQMLENWEFAAAKLGSDRARGIKATLVSGIIGLVVGLVGFFGIGVFSEDRSTIGVVHNLHLIVSIMVWGGLAFASLMYGLAALRLQAFIPRILGFFMMVGPVTSAVLFMTAAFILPEFLPSRPLEWVMLACAFWWMVPVAVIMLRRMKNGIHPS